MKRTLFFIIALVFIASLSFSQTKVNINNLEEYGGAMFKIDDDKPYSGRVFALYKNTDNKKLEGLYRDGLKNGKWTWWHENGDIYSKGSFRAGLMSGQWEFYYSNSKIMAVGHYRNGDGTNEDKNGISIHGRQSKWAFWHKNGFKSDEQTWKNGKRDGVFTSWHYTGARASEITYINGNINYFRGSRTSIVPRCKHTISLTVFPSLFVAFETVFMPKCPLALATMYRDSVFIFIRAISIPIMSHSHYFTITIIKFPLATHQSSPEAALTINITVLMPPGPLTIL
jgi:hypothetical protein